MAKRTTNQKQKPVRLKIVFSGTRALVCLVLLALLVGAYFLVPRWFPINVDLGTSDENALVWHTVDVGQGDCTIVQFPDDKVLMVDAGSELHDKSSTTILKYLQTWQITKIDWFVITHPDEDHYGGATKLLANEDLTFGALYHSTAYDKYKEKATYYALVEKYNFQAPIDGEQIKGTDYDYTITFVSPFATDTAKDSNDASLMMTIEYGNKIFVLTGDASDKMDDTFITHASAMGIFDNKMNKQIILKVAHHGSRTGSSDTFLKFIFSATLGNNYALISCGLDNSYFHPHEEALNRLENYVATENILVTKDIGNIVIQATTNTLTINDIEAPFSTISYTTIFITIGVVIIVLCFCQFNTKTTKRK